MKRVSAFLMMGVAVVAMSPAGSQAESVSGETANEANNPLTPKITINLQDYYIPSIKGFPERDSNQFLLRGVMPHKARPSARRRSCAPRCPS